MLKVWACGICYINLHYDDHSEDPNYVCCMQLQSCMHPADVATTSARMRSLGYFDILRIYADDQDVRFMIQSPQMGLWVYVYIAFSHDSVS